MPIPIVKTWKDLQALPAIDLGDGVKIRLGLQSDKAPRWSSVYLYCLTEGFPPAKSKPRTAPGDPLGPICVAFDFGDLESAREQVKRIEDGSEWPKGSYLFARPLSVNRIGPYHVRVTDDKGKLIAKAAVECTKDFFHPWMPWLEGYEKPITPWEGIAQPNLDRYSPLVFVGPGKTKKGGLPTTAPADLQPSLTIKKVGNEIIIRADSEFTTSRPERHFLARWWVNGKPFTPTQRDQLLLFDGYGKVSEEKELRLPIEFRPERIGAKAGDKIGMQLLHSESGWSWCLDSNGKSKMMERRKNGENLRLSNRLEFFAPKSTQQPE